MIRKQISITRLQDEELKRIKREKGVPQSVTVRKALDQYLKQKGDSNE